MNPLTAIDEAVRALQAGCFVVVADDEDRENEGDLILAAEHATEDRIAFLLRHTTGICCVAIDADRARMLRLESMVSEEENRDAMRTAFTVTVDHDASGTGVSAADRALTIRAIASPATSPTDLRRPGHVFPLVARPGGVLKRAGHTEAAVDLLALAGMRPAGVLCELVDDEHRGMLRGEALRRFARENGLPFLTIADLVRYRRSATPSVRRVSSARMPVPSASMTCHVYESLIDGHEHLAFVSGLVTDQPVLVRVHSECLTGDVFRSLRCDCGEQLETAMSRIALEGGVLVYLRGHEGRGIGLGHKIRAYALQDQGLDTVEANEKLGLPIDDREYGVGAQILADLGVRRIRLLTNNPRKYRGLEGYSLTIEEQVPLRTSPNPENVRYLETKRTKLAHDLIAVEGKRR